MAARPYGVSAMLITPSYRLQFRFKVRFKSNLVSVGTRRIETTEKARVIEEYYIVDPDLGLRMPHSISVSVDVWVGVAGAVHSATRHFQRGALAVRSAPHVHIVRVTRVLTLRSSFLKQFLRRIFKSSFQDFIWNLKFFTLFIRVLFAVKNTCYDMKIKIPE